MKTILVTGGSGLVGTAIKTISQNYEHMMEFDSSFSDGQYKKTVSNKIIKNILNNDFKFTNIETGINYSIEWFLENYI